MKLYTFVMDYIGGTYISQYKAGSKEIAMQLWIGNLKVNEIEGFTENDQAAISQKGFETDDPCLLKGLTNVWHFIVDTKKGTGYVNMVLTDTNIDG